MKKIITITLLALTILKVSAQDIIVKNDKTEIKAKIEELTETSIKYKKTEMIDGPSYNINKRDVFMIIYKNGSKEYMETTNSQPAVVQAPPMQENRQPPNTQNRNNSTMNSQNNIIPNNGGGHEEIKFIKKGQYSFEGEEIEGYQGYYDIFNKYGYKDLSASLKAQTKVIYISGGFALGGLLGVALTKGNLQWAFIGVAIGGLISMKPYKPITSSVAKFNTRANKRLSFNQKLEFKPLFKKNEIGNHVGVSIGF